MLLIKSFDSQPPATPINLWMGFLETTNLTLAIVDREINYLLCSKQWLKHHNLENQEVVGRNYYQIFPHTNDQEREQHQQCLLTGSSISYEQEIYLETGKTQWLNITINPWPTETGEIGGLIISKEDITIQKYCENVAEELNERKQIQNELNQSFNLLDTVIEAIPDPIFVKNRQGKYLLLNEATCMVFQKTKDQVIGNVDTDFLDRPIAEALMQIDQKVMEEEKTQIIDEVLIVNGKKQIFQSIKTVYRNKEGEVIGLIGIARDITELKRIEEQLQKSQNNLLKAQQIAHIGSWEFDLITRKTTWSEELVNICGINPQQEEITQQELNNIVHPEDQSILREKVNLALQGTPYELEYRIIRPDGSIRYVYNQGEPIFNEVNQVIKLFGISQDITEKKLVEIDLKKYQSHLEELVKQRTIALEFTNQKLSQEIKEREQLETSLIESYRLLEAVLEGVNDPIFVKDIQGRYILANSATAISIGRTTPEIIGQTDIDIFGRETGQRLQENDRQIMTTGQPEMIEEFIPYSTGETNVFLVSKSPYKDAMGNIIGLFGVARNITSRKQVENALRQSEARLAEAQKVAHVGYWEYELNKEEDIFWSDELYRIVGLEPTSKIEDKSKYYAGLMLTKDKIKALRLTTISKKNKTFFQFDHQLFLPDGTIKFVAIKAQPMLNERGEVLILCGTVLDITDRKIIEAALLKEKHFSQKITATIPQLLYIFDCQERTHVYINQSTREVLGFSLDEIKNMGHNSLPNLVHPQDFPLVLQHHKAIANTKENNIFEIEYRIRNVRGIWIWLYSRETIFSKDQQGNPKLILGSAEDITRRKQAEIALRESKSLLLEKANREMLINQLSHLIRNSLDVRTILQTAVNEIRDQFQISYCSFVWYKNEYNPPQWHIINESRIPKIPSFLGKYHINEQLSPLLMGLLALKTIRIDDINKINDQLYQDVLISKNIFSSLCVPLLMRNNSIGVFCCCQHEQTRQWTDGEEELLEAVCNQLVIAISQGELYAQSQEAARLATLQAAQLEETLEQLQKAQTQLIQSEKMSSLGQMVAGLAHEMNNPISFIFGNVEYASEYINILLDIIHLYQRYYPSPHPEILAAIENENYELNFIVEDLGKLMQSMKMGAVRIRDIVLSLRSFSRLDEAEIKPIFLHDAIDSTLMILQHRLNNLSHYPPIEVIKNYGQLPKVECYAGQMNQVFMNLLSNAIDALNEGFFALNSARENIKPRQILITTFVKENLKVVVIIADTGPGITPEIKTRLFDPFFTTKPVGRGTGLGLAISYQIVEKHNGNLSCLSTPGIGSEFIVEIPIKQSKS